MTFIIIYIKRHLLILLRGSFATSSMVELFRNEHDQYSRTICLVGGYSEQAGVGYNQAIGVRIEGDIQRQELACCILATTNE